MDLDRDSRTPLERRSPGSPDPGDIVVTGLGAVSALGEGFGALWDAVSQGRGGIEQIQRFDVDGFAGLFGALVPGAKADALDSLCVEFATRAVAEAWEQARVGAAGLPWERIALVMGASPIQNTLEPHRFAERVALAFGIVGPRITVSTACTSSNTALGIGCDLLDAGDADLVVAGGADVLTLELLAGFRAVGLLSAGKCAPFSVPMGITLGEGAGFLVLESRARAEARGAEPRATLLGHALSGDAFHETSPDPHGSGVARALRNTLAHAGLSPADVGYINAHGTGSAVNDAAEWRAIQTVFGELADGIPVSSSKGHLGHAQNAAGVLETITTIIAMQRGYVPPTLQFTTARPHAPTDPVGTDLPRPCSYDYALCANSAFGGSNAALALGRPAAGRKIRQRRDVFVLGAGIARPDGDAAAGRSQPARKAKNAGTRAAPVDLGRLLPRADLRGLDPSALYLTGAAASALADADLVLRGEARERAGLIVGATRFSPSSGRQFRQSIETRGVSRVSTNAFRRMVLNAAQGSCAKLLSLKGPQTTVSTGRGSGLFAILYGAHLLAERTDADLMVAGGVEELPGTAREPDEGAEGAACVLLGIAGQLTPTKARPRIRVPGWASAGPGRFADAAARALSRAGCDPAKVDAVFGFRPEEVPSIKWNPRIVDSGGIGLDREAKYGGAVGSAFACADAVEFLRRGFGTTVLIGDPGAGSAGCALVLRVERGEHGS